MAETTTIESFGFIIKKETLSLFASEYKFSELILEELDPLAGFYDHFHIPLKEEEKKPRSIFALTKEISFEQMDDFIRMNATIKKDFKAHFNAVMGRLDLQNALVTCIRIYMDDYAALPPLIEEYKLRGIHFLPARSVKEYSSLINIRKYMVIKQIHPSIYKDSQLKDTYYFTVKEYVTWPIFESITSSIRINSEHKVYDAAQAGIYNQDGIVEMVRIYDPKATVEHLLYLKEKYELEIARSLYQTD
ncbi:MAG: hypothetical protein WCQ70_07920 [Lentimicrobiaceae bacterium]